MADSYDALAPAYDTLTRAYDYDRWLAVVHDLAARHGGGGHTLLDVACGTGKSFLPLRERGYAVTGVDVSPRMLAVAARKAPDVPLHVADMRTLPALGAFDLVTCLDDALNHLLTPADLEAALRGIARNLARRGVAVWDVNTLAMYRGQFSETYVIAEDDRFVVWEGGVRAFGAGDEAEAAVHDFARGDDGLWRRSDSRHRQRHWTEAAIERAAARAGLRIAARLGQRSGVGIDATCDESVHVKALYVATPDHGREVTG